MGSVLSALSSLWPSQPAARPLIEDLRPRVGGRLVPTEADPVIYNWYANFFEVAYCLQHANAEDIIIFTPVADEDHGEYPNTRSRPGWPIKRLRKAYELLGQPHPRIVRYVGALHSEAGDGVVVEKLKPGPFCFTIPVMTVPVAPTISREDKIMLSLHYRWALQVLSAFRCMHSRSVYAGFFSSQLAWIRTDFSLAVTGFISASATEIEDEFWDDVHEDSRARLPDSYLPQEGGRQEDQSSYSVSCGWDEGEGVEAEMITYDGSFAGLHVQGSVQKDLFYWATFVWRLMTNDYTTSSPSSRGKAWEPVYPMDGGDAIDGARDIDTILEERQRRKLFQQLERCRLGHVLVDAWNGRYSSVDDVVRDIELEAIKVGITVSGDEVDIGEKWEDVFEMKDGELDFKLRTNQA